MRAGSGKPTVHPDSAPWADDGAGVVVVRVRATTGEVVLMEPEEITVDLDRLLTSKEVCALVGIAPGTWRTYVMRGNAPRPDAPDTETPVNRRSPKWKLRTVQTWQDTRPGQGRKRR